MAMAMCPRGSNTNNGNKYSHQAYCQVIYIAISPMILPLHHHLKAFKISGDLDMVSMRKRRTKNDE